MRRRFTGQESPIVNDPYAIVLAHFNGDYINEANRQQLTNRNTSFNTGKFGQGLQFNSYGNISENRFIPEYNSITTSFWIYTDGENTSNEFVISYGGANEFVITRAEGHQYFIGTGIYNSIITLNAGWNYIVYTLERSGTLTGLANYYVNGNKILTDPVTVNFSPNGISSISASTIRDGALIDELAINRGYRSPLIIPRRAYSSLEDIYPIADPAPDKPLLLCHFNNNLINSVNNRLPTLNELPAPIYDYTDGKFSTSALDVTQGSFTYQITNSGTLNQLVFDCWIKDSSQRFNFTGATTGINNIILGITLSVNSSGVCTVRFTDNIIDVATAQGNLGEYNHFLVTFGDYVSVWVNGELIYTRTSSINITTLTSVALVYGYSANIDELYVTSGSLRIPVNTFTPPTSEYIYVR